MIHCGAWTRPFDVENGFEVVGEASDGYQAVGTWPWRLHPDVVLMDVRMPGLDAVAATEHRGTGARHPHCGRR